MKELNEKISALVDDESQEVDTLIKQLVKDEELQHTWQRYHLIKDAMNGHLSEHPSLDVSSQVSKALEDEAVVFAPRFANSLRRRLNPRNIMKQAAGLAVAAAVGTVAILSVQQTQLVNNSGTTIIADAGVIANSEVKKQGKGQLRQVAFTTRGNLDVAVESKLSGYLVNHNEYSKSLRVSGIMPYTRIVSFVPANPQLKNKKSQVKK